ncbi:hypothetical protein QTP70_024923 [Hemibagrus guttatus]|uniref:Synaptotagmin-like protein 2 n=1 Tax=Hemibagrus guttatus TaxID=175788 RepID=A0AAE0QT79_9TELE|nr:hypothetical protein QTP70_024923 [Hemibagrus guttatus]
MIDLSYLTEEEQEAIMAVLKRDAELKKTEEERVKHLQKQGPEEGKLKYITGEWFYEVKSQRHQDRIHGSDIIMASMKQKKPMTVGDQQRLSKKVETGFFFIRFQQRHNPFNNVPMDLDLDETNGASMPETKTPPGTAEVPPPLENREGSEIEAKAKIFNISQETIPHQKPVPKKRTKIFKVQNSDSTSSVSTQSVSTNSSVSTQSVSTSSSTSPVSTQSMSTNSDSRSALSTQSTSTNSEIRSLPPKGILKHSSSCDSNTKSRLPQPRKSLSMASTKSGHEHILEENAVTQESIDESLLNFTEDKEPPKSTFPPSRLPVRSTMLLNNPTQTSKEKPKIQPRLSRSSSTQSNDEQKTADVLDTKQKCENSLNWLISAEAEKQNIADGMMKEPLSIPRIKARSPFESLLAKPLNESITPQISLKNQDKEDLKISKREYEKTEEKLDRPSGIRDRLVYEATNPTNASNKTDPSLEACESDHMPSPFDIKITRDSNMKTKNCKNPLMVNPYSPKASEEKGDSIAKVLEWFSRSSDSSDKLDCEGIIPDIEDDIKIEDMDFENEINSRPKAENNVYLIIPRHRDEDRDKDVTKCLGQKSSSSQDFRLQIVGDHSDENSGGNSTMEGFTPAAVLELDRKVKKSPEMTKSKHKATDRSTSEDPDSQPLARSFGPRDYQHYLGITVNRGKHISPQADVPIDDAELCTRRGIWGLRPSAHASEDLKPETLNRDDSFSGASANSTEVSLVQEVLRRAPTRPVYHKSFEDITAVPRRSKKSKHVDNFVPSSYANSSTPSPSSSSFSDKERLRKISKSVPSFLENENDGDESESECSSQSGKHWKNSSPQAELNNNPRMATVSSMSGSIMSISSVDFGNIEVQGTIQFSINYVQKLREFHIFVVQCQNLAAVDVKRNRSDPYVKSYLLPDAANLGKRKTSVKKKTVNPTYNEILRYRVRLEHLKTQVLNLSVWHNDIFGRNSFLGEAEIDLSKWDFGSPRINCLPLKPRNTSSVLSTDDRGEMRLAIRFLPQISFSKPALGSGEIHIWVRDCKNLPLIRGVTVNPYVKCYVLPDTSKKSCQKTRVLKRTASPVFNHTMVYDGFRTEDLKEACVELTVWDRDRLADHLVGGLRLGLGTGQSYGTKVDWMDSIAKEVALWQRMMDSPNEWVEDVLPLRMVTAAKNTLK